METQKFLAATRIYEQQGGKTRCSPIQSCEGETSDSVILKDLDRNVVAEILLPSNSLVERERDNAEDQTRGVSQISSSNYQSAAGMFCHFVATLTLVGGLSGALSSLDRSTNGLEVLVSLGFAASAAPVFAIGSIAHNTKRSAISAQQMAELSKKDIAVGKPQGQSQVNDGEE